MEWSITLSHDLVLLCNSLINLRVEIFQREMEAKESLKKFGFAIEGILLVRHISMKEIPQEWELTVTSSLHI
jgi:hypothetical protein